MTRRAAEKFSCDTKGLRSETPTGTQENFFGGGAALPHFDPVVPSSTARGSWLVHQARGAPGLRRTRMGPRAPRLPLVGEERQAVIRTITRAIDSLNDPACTSASAAADPVSTR